MREFHLTPSRPLAVAIATMGRPLLLKRTLDSLASCAKPATYDGTWIIENGPAGGVQQIVASYGAEQSFRYIHVPEANKSGALNSMLAHAGDALLFFTDDDVRFDRHTLSAYEKASAGVAKGQFYGGPLEVEYDTSQPAESIKRMLPMTACGWRRDEKRIACVPRPRFLGPNWAAFASDLRRVGGFDPRLGPGSEADCTGNETEIQHRLRRDGVAGFYVPEAIVWHLVRSESLTSEWVVARAIRHGREWGIQRARRYPPRTIEHYARVRYWFAALAARRLKDKPDDRDAKLQAAHRIAKWQGRLEGLAIGYNHDWRVLPPIQSAPVSRKISA